MKIIKLLILILFLVSPFIFHIFKKNLINSLNIKISKLTTEVQNLERSVMFLESMWREETHPEAIEKKAQNILNMKYPEKGEVLKIEDF
ncbi:MAG: hypothetical protein ABIN61_00690 [candidate division WOR-3 bacterium]